MLRVCAALQVPDEDVPVVAGRQDDARVEGVRLQHKHLGLVALWRRHTLVWTLEGGWGGGCMSSPRPRLTLRICSSCPV